MNEIEKIEKAPAAFLPQAQKINEVIDFLKPFAKMEGKGGIKIESSDNNIIFGFSLPSGSVSGSTSTSLSSLPLALYTDNVQTGSNFDFRLTYGSVDGFPITTPSFPHFDVITSVSAPAAGVTNYKRVSLKCTWAGPVSGLPIWTDVALIVSSQSTSLPSLPSNAPINVTASVAPAGWRDYYILPLGYVFAQSSSLGMRGVAVNDDYGSWMSYFAGQTAFTWVASNAPDVAPEIRSTQGINFIRNQKATL